MANIDEIETTIKLLKKRNKVILMHCVSLYPVKINEANLNRIISLKNKYKLEIGYSDHTIGSDAIKVAASMGCKIFEKHFTLNKKLKGPDHHLSMNSKELKEIIISLKSILILKGNGYINPYGREINSRKIFRRCIVAKQNIKRGQIIKEKMICLRRPANGLHPKYFYKILGNKAKKNFKINQKIII